MRPAIVFIHGFKGSVLRQRASGSCSWITAPAALWGSQTLALPGEGLQIDGALDLCVDGVLERVCIVPRLLYAQVYGPWLKAVALACAGRAQIVPFAYDWRRSNLEAVRALAALVDALRARGAPAVHLVAHSMGGLIAAYYLRYGTQALALASETWTGAAAVDRVVIAGTPYRGLMRAFHDMACGAVAVRNRTLLGPVAVASMPAAYQLLPWPAADKVLSPSLSPEPQAIYQARHWRDGGWGLFADAQALPDAAREARYAYCGAHLDGARRWFELLHAPLARRPRPGSAALLTIRGGGYATSDRAVWCRDSGALLFDSRRARRRLSGGGAVVLTADGDQTVTLESAALPTAYREGLVTTALDFRVGHAGMYSDRGVQRAVLDFLSV